MPSGRILHFLSIGCHAIAATIVLHSISSAAPISLQNNPKAVLDKAWQIVNQNYVDPQFNQVNWQKVRQTLLSQNYSSRAAAYNALRNALKQLNDPYTRFLDPQEFQALNSNDINGELTGIGVQLAANPQSNGFKAIAVMKNSPASRAGIQPGDIVLAIDDLPIQGLSADRVVSMIRGAANTQVKIHLSRSEQLPYTVTLTRQRIQISLVNAALRQQGDRRIGYIRLDEFSGHAAEQMQQAIADLTRQGADRFVLDLRGNPGGLLDEETAIARMWLDRGKIVRIVDRDRSAQQLEANHTALTNRPLAVLVDGNSASASEILSGALKDNHRAIVVGTQTFGKALVQSVNSLSDGSGINVTIAHYYTPAGLDINHRGITPNIVTPLTKQQQQALSNHPDELGTAQDPQYQRAVNALTNEQSTTVP